MLLSILIKVPDTFNSPRLYLLTMVIYKYFKKKNFNNLSTYSDISQINRLGYITERPSDYSTPHPPKSHSLPTTSRLNGNPAEGTGRGLDGVDR